MCSCTAGRLPRDERTALADYPCSGPSGSDARVELVCRMIPAVSIDDILARAKAYGSTADPLGQRLVSIVFANPRSPIWADVHTNRAFLDARSGDKWDLFFAGLSRFAPMESIAATDLGPPRRLEEGSRYFNPRDFERVESAIRTGQAEALRQAGRDDRPWHYSGETDLVSFMVSDGHPDWLTVCDLRLYDNAESALSVGELTERFGAWESQEHLSLAEIVRENKEFAGVDSVLIRALRASAWAVTGGVLGNSVYDLIRLIVRS